MIKKRKKKITLSYIIVKVLQTKNEKENIKCSQRKTTHYIGMNTEFWRNIAFSSDNVSQSILNRLVKVLKKEHLTKISYSEITKKNHPYEGKTSTNSNNHQNKTLSDKQKLRWLAAELYKRNSSFFPGWMQQGKNINRNCKYVRKDSFYLVAAKDNCLMQKF